MTHAPAKIYVRGPLSARYAARVDIRAPHECWPWIGHRNVLGYGTLTIAPGQSVLAHRLGWELATGEAIPSGLILLHSCDNPPCCNTEHLRLGTHKDNMGDCIARRRHPGMTKTHCKHGHEFTPENTLWTEGGRLRNCRTCKRARGRKTQQSRSQRAL